MHGGGVAHPHQEARACEPPGGGEELAACQLGLALLFPAHLVEKSLAGAGGGLPVVADEVGPLVVEDEQARQRGVAPTGQLHRVVQRLPAGRGAVHRDDDPFQHQVVRTTTTSTSRMLRAMAPRSS